MKVNLSASDKQAERGPCRDKFPRDAAEKKGAHQHIVDIE